MDDLIDAARRIIGSDVRDALVATPLRKLLVNIQWPVTFWAAFSFGAQTPGWLWPALVIVQLALTIWVGNRLADHDALLAEYIAETDAEPAEREAAEQDVPDR